MVYSLDLDITSGGVPQIVKLSQYDKTIPEIQAVLWNGPSGYTIPTGATVWVAGTKPDKTGFEYQCTYSGSTVTIDITEQMTVVAGRVPVEVIVETATGRKGSANFFLDVEPAALADDTIISDTDIPIIQQIPEILEDCEDYADLAHKWATYGSDSEEPSATNNSKYWAEKSQEYAVGALHWKGSIEFADIPTSGMVTGDLYNITDDFTTDNRFTEGAGIECPAGTDIVWGANDKWDLPLSATNATQVKYGNTTVAAELNQINTSLSDKQNSTDNSLTTTDKTIPGAINELNSNLSDLNGYNDDDMIQTYHGHSITPDSGSAYQDGSSYSKYGYMVYLLLSVQGLTPNTTSVITTLPVGYRPDHNQHYVGTDGTGTGCCDITVKANGQITVYTGSQYCMAAINFIAMN